MNETHDIELGPLKDLIGVWQGDVGIDIAPEPEGTETNHYYEKIIYSLVGDVSNAETQNLTAVHYRQTVQRKITDKVIHDQTGYWMWDSETGTVMHSLLIPRGVCVLAGGTYQGEKDDENRTIINVAAKINDPDWNIIQSPFMQNNALTEEFSQQLIVGNGTLIYSQTSMLNIYGRVFEHTDQNELVLT